MMILDIYDIVPLNPASFYMVLGYKVQSFCMMEVYITIRFCIISDLANQKRSEVDMGSNFC